MKVVLVALTAWLGAASLASASLVPQREPRQEKKVAFERSARLAALARQQAAEGAAGREYTMTDETEVTLNGRPCPYAEIPTHASILWMEVAADNKTVLRVHFRTRK
jgi:hypothetical protein